jgi:glycosyltransferase involved in cell wall biosynthesis
MAKLVLTQIMKNEAHVITRMLNSIKPVVDIICLVDTGSTDNTIEVVKNWGQENGIETHVFERPFDNFENSRNYSIQMAREVTQGRGNDFWGFWLDADEVLEIQPHFNKNGIDKDLYMFNTYINVMKYTRNECYKLDKPFRFYGPVHEFIVCDEKNITSGLMDGLVVRVQMDGGSWKGNIPEKYKSHAFVLEKYIDANRQDPRWIFYTAQSYHDSACFPDNKQENEERLRRSMKYYKERISRMDGYPEEIFYSQFRVGTIMRTLEEPWSKTLNEFLKAYSLDPLRAEPIKAIVDYYLHVGEWHNAYLFSKFLRVNFHQKNPYPQRLLFVDEALYSWKILESHAASCFYTNRRDEGRQSFQELLKISREQPQFFTPDDLNKIQMNSQFFA